MSDLQELERALSRGPVGRDGRDGRDGLDGLDGEPGVQGIRGLVGPQGIVGIDGKDGRDGLHGKDGAPGADGINGKDGRDGVDGRNGVDGKDGAPGPRGLRGPQGDPGPEGPRGDIGPMPDHEWDDTRLRFETSPGRWGHFVDLRGPRGRSGGVGGGWGSSISLIGPRVGSISYGAVMTADFAAQDSLKLTLTGDGSITLSGAADQQRVQLEIKQDVTGSRLLTFGSEVRYGDDLAAITLSATGSKTDRLAFVYDAADGKYDLVALMKGY